MAKVIYLTGSDAITTRRFWKDKYTEDIICRLSEKEKIDFIVEQFNKEQPERQHIYDIIENYLIDFTGF